jgi:ATP-dependent HslUV protease ATP-binding subunit HslU
VTSLRPSQIVEELDRYIVGQTKAKRAVAIALRNRYRRQLVQGDLKDEILPKNIIMIGPTGVGKTEIARRLARLAQAPFVKVEASKFTEVGYVGRDVDSMIRDLAEVSVKLVREEEAEKFRAKAREVAEERLVELLTGVNVAGFGPPGSVDRQRTRAQLRAGTLDDQMVEVDVPERNVPFMTAFSGQGMEEIGVNMENLFGGLFPKRSRKRRMRVQDALKVLVDEEAGKMVDMDRVQRDALQRVEQSGIVFIDEIDKIAGRERGVGPDVSREGVQRDILPIVEGSTVTTKYGTVRTDHILFIAAGAFHISKPSDLIPELQGRFPIRVELDPLTRDDLVRILTEPQSSLIRQYTALLETEGVKVEFRNDAIQEIAQIAQLVNERSENIGARRLYTIMERLLDELSFNADQSSLGHVVIDRDYVLARLQETVKDEDLSRYIL